MAFARDVFTATASQTDFTITYPYQEEEDVKVYVNGVLKTATTDYTFFSSTVIRLVVASTENDVVILQRSTSQAARDVVFVAGALTEEDMNDAAIQAWYMAQEAMDIAETMLGMVATTNAEWDAESKRITLVSDPTGVQDAATKSYVDTVALGSLPTPLNIANGGTGATTADGALTAFGGGSKGIAIFKDTTSAAVLAELGGGSKGIAIFGDTTSDAVLTELGAGATGKAIFADATAAAVLAELGGGSKGIAIFGDTTNDAVLTELGAGATGKAIFADATAAAVLAELGGGSKGIAIFADTTSDAVLTELGAGTTGKAIFADATAGAVRTEIGVYSTAEVDSADTAAIATAAAVALALVDDLSGVSDSSTALDNLGAGATGKAIFADATAAAVLAELGGGTTGLAIFADATAAAVRTEIGLVIDTDVPSQASHDAIDVLTTRGDILYFNATVPARLAVGTVGQVLTSDGTDVAWASGGGSPDASDTVKGIIEIATAAEIATGSSTVLAVTPGRMVDSAVTAGAWLYATWPSGTPTAGQSFNIGTLDDDGTGLCGVNFVSSFSAATYSATLSGERNVSWDDNSKSDARNAAWIDVTIRLNLNYDGPFNLHIFGT